MPAQKPASMPASPVSPPQCASVLHTMYTWYLVSSNELYRLCSSSRKVSGLTPTEVFAQATPKECDCDRNTNSRNVKLREQQQQEKQDG
jgi:hypothetical protein